MSLLQIAYLIDALVTLPVALVTLVGHGTRAEQLFAEKLPEDPSVRITLGSLWMAIAVGSAAGIAFPLAMSPVLVLQVIYKGLWILLFAMPRWLSGRAGEVPRRTAIIFLLFVAVYPWLIPWSDLFSLSDLLSEERIDR